ncbi:MAG: hypothetical protein IPI21_05810 [Propionivibrio sp.]|nr:hypothetical protein [Propionivibrio sp.]
MPIGTYDVARFRNPGTKRVDAEAALTQLEADGAGGGQDTRPKANSLANHQGHLARL